MLLVRSYHSVLTHSLQFLVKTLYGSARVQWIEGILKSVGVEVWNGGTLLILFFNLNLFLICVKVLGPACI